MIRGASISYLSSDISRSMHSVELDVGSLYEQKHLSKEADTCMKFKSRHHEFTNLASLDDVVTNSGLSSDALEELKSNSHKQTMARLELELKQRQEMKNQLDTERASLASRKDKILEKDGKLKKVDNQLLKLLEVTGPICDTFGIDTDKIIAVNSQAAHLKSTKLSYLFKQISQQVNDKDFKCLKSPKVESSKSADEEWAFSLNSSIEGKLTDFCMKFKHEDPVDTTSPVQVCCNQPYIAACLFQEAEKYGFVDGESPAEADKTTVRSKILVWLRNVVIFEDFQNHFRPKNKIFKIAQ